MKFIQTMRKLQFLLILALGTVPLPLMLFSSHGQSLLPFTWIYPAMYTLLAMVCLFLPGKWRLLCGVVAALIFVGCGILLPSGMLRIVSGIPAVGYGVMLLWSLKIGGWGKEEELPGYLYGSLFALQLVGQMSLLMNGNTGNGAMVPYGPLMKISFVVFLLLALLSMNRKGLREATQKRQRLSSAMYRKNTLLTLGLFGFGLLVSLAPSAYRWVKQLLLWIAMVVLKLMMLFSPPQSSGETSGGGSQGGMPMADGGPPSALALFLEKIVTVAAVALIAVLGAMLLYRIGRALVRIARVLWKRLERYAEHVAVDYIDEITDTREDSSPERIRRRGASRRVFAREMRNMTPVEKIRYRYLRLLVRNPQWSPGSTPREKLPRDLASVYEAVRYGGYVATEEEAAAFTAGTKHL